jgi:hypothetical protein
MTTYVAHELCQIPSGLVDRDLFLDSSFKDSVDTLVSASIIRTLLRVLRALHDCSNTNAKTFLEFRATRIQDDICLAYAPHRLILDVQIRSALH